MEVRKTQQAPGIFLACCFTVFGTSAFSETNIICESIFKLRDIHKQSTLTQSISSPLDAIKILNRFATELETISARSASPVLGRMSDDLFGIVAETGTVTGVQLKEFDANGSDLFRELSKHMEDLNQVEGMFGCKNAEMPVAEFEPPSPKHVSRASLGLWSKVSGMPAMRDSYSVLAAFVFLMSLIAAFALNWGRQDARKICRTSILVVYGDQCTVTHIIDISRRGMKIEAAQKDVKKVWVDLYFCGHKVQGKIIWRNTYYAGIKFKTKLSQQTLDDVIENSRKPLGESGLGENATPCFSIGCHANCPHHLPTAISEKQAAK